MQKTVIAFESPHLCLSYQSITFLDGDLHQFHFGLYHYVRFIFMFFYFFATKFDFKFN